MELKNKKINFIGDSITEGVGTSAKEHIYLNVLKGKEGLAEARNYGISGSRIARQSNYIEEGAEFAYVDRFYKMDNDADVVVVFGGTNDFGHGDAVIGTFEDRVPNTFYGACHLLMSGLINKYPTGTIVIMTPIQRSAGGADINRIHPTKIGLELIDFVNIIKEVALYYSLPVLDLYAMGGIHPDIEANKIAYCPDGLHPNDEGNKLIASRLAGFLKSL